MDMDPSSGVLGNPTRAHIAFLLKLVFAPCTYLCGRVLIRTRQEYLASIDPYLPRPLLSHGGLDQR
jgi:hypothetical protein